MKGFFAGIVFGTPLGVLVMWLVFKAMPQGDIGCDGATIGGAVAGAFAVSILCRCNSHRREGAK